ncbi:tRNA-splicing endonuclease subunit [Coemansia sp. RSA 1813]|nr:tRNA-splicing endonuclease subunit [Coemansia sp. RSA 1646]KAJ1771780.1 tRNA-splicing endonuclease subunit [Coemansia sp. RSA 1843]KAJ2093395.1 tRNA-splicing endonuclease subunit [Coemansia sp. RSA 986]KAJ2217203.1 tRNA-splicing endonuclease subunit [Coemansia sp. RSA 487]KAJ2572401.1 tRNA-splicing endonuclease subunit [Coemansia sp. RSA 1813]
MDDEQPKEQPFKLHCGNDNQVLVFDADVAMALRTEYRIVGSLEGSHPKNPLQNGYMYLPLLLLPEETALLLEKGAIELSGMAFTWPQIETDKARFELFKDLHQRRFYITRALKFGGDYLLYPGEPMRYHSSHIVTFIPNNKQPLAPRELISLVRLGTTVKKTRVLSSWNPDKSEFTHVCMNWSSM